MILSQDDIGQIADRIERAYRRRHPLWQSIGVTPGVWETAAARLFEVLEESPDTPVDPELFVAIQPATHNRRDPWSELTQDRSLKLYVRAVRQIIGQLREELRDEVRRAERRILRGTSLDQLVAGKKSRLSPLTRYIIAMRAGRDDLSAGLRSAAESQHRSCPLYCLASRPLMPSGEYPMPPDEDSIASFTCRSAEFSLN